MHAMMKTTTTATVDAIMMVLVELPLPPLLLVEVGKLVGTREGEADGGEVGVPVGGDVVGTLEGNGVVGDGKGTSVGTDDG